MRRKVPGSVGLVEQSEVERVNERLFESEDERCIVLLLGVRGRMFVRFS